MGNSGSNLSRVDTTLKVNRYQTVVKNGSINRPQPHISPSEAENTGMERHYSDHYAAAPGSSSLISQPTTGSSLPNHNPSDPNTSKDATETDLAASGQGNGNSSVLVEVLVSAVQLGVIGVAYYYCANWLYKHLQGQQSPQRSGAMDAKDAQTYLEGVAKGRKTLGDLQITEYEALIAKDVLDPDQISVTFKDVGGVDGIKSELWDLVVLPLVRPDLFISESGLTSPPRGILLYGAPGTGKTMLAKAMAKESSATFVNVRLSAILDKWFGESNKLVHGVFSLAQKLAPSIIFIDEIDTFLSQRESGDGNAATTNGIKSEFLTLWDGMMTDASKPVLVLGATNRPYDVDAAILRRLPRSFEIGLPNLKSRDQVLQLVLKKLPMTPDCRIYVKEELPTLTEGYSGSDLKELCRAAAMEPIRQVTMLSSRRAVGMGGAASDEDSTMEFHKTGASIVGPEPGVPMRPVEQDDFVMALQKVKRTGETARAFLRKENSFVDGNSGVGAANSDSSLAHSMQLLQALLRGSINAAAAPVVEEASSNSTSYGDYDDIPNI
uniref:AAA+ ATPase domain-containing protein n=1 Tax=Attheya septentrionalis TaxID=420275 RepID=A0A7S2UF48_9STRA|mmetsp:Transcript_22714/g.41059  ORF Transcript_22714/g.41059 Transcript_22714/m.41059 type:complete len:551 (+) Transcript_22714:265-1917(+)